MYEQDSDVLHWGLDILHGDPFSNTGYCGGTTQNDANFYDSCYVGEGNIGTDRTTIENDEIIAHALQEEFSQLAVAEANGPSHADEEHLQASVLAQDWFGPSMRNYSSGKQMINIFCSIVHFVSHFLSLCSFFVIVYAIFM